MTKESTVDKQIEIIKRGTVEIISEDQLRKKIEKSLKEKSPLIIKAGFDPSAPDIHLGHTVLLRKLRHFQQAGHKVIFLIGDATALIGDPSGQSKTRRTLSWEEIEKNVATYEKQISGILDVHNARLYQRCYNSDWFSRRGHLKKRSAPFTFDEFVDLAKRYTVARLLERDDFQKRLKENKPVSFLELFYPLMQGYDSVKLQADIEIGGTDQKFNMLVGRNLQEAYGQEPQVVITMPILEGLDGARKMSKSLNNYIGITEPADEMYGKVMSVSDELMSKYYELLTDIDSAGIKEMHPMQAKKALAREIVRQFHGAAQAQTAQERFEKTYQLQDPFSEIQTRTLKVSSQEDLRLVNLLCGADKLNLVKSRSDFRRLIEQNAVSIDEKKINDHCCQLEFDKEYCIRIGKHRFIRLIVKKA
ncbi:MAG: tyrosine--tRNA ligase [Candidatus Omnitrophota bacterium]